MAVKIRLQRRGAKHNPCYRIVATDSRKPRDGRFIEILGNYTPKAKQTEHIFNVKVNRIDYWLSVGAQPTDTVRSLIKKARKKETAHSKSVLEDSTSP
jgi:small subunit ribosomal protein S16